jgi:hypothetical protein
MASSVVESETAASIMLFVAVALLPSLHVVCGPVGPPCHHAMIIITEERAFSTRPMRCTIGLL